MAETYLCDECDERIERGYTVAWCPDLENNAHGIAWDRQVKHRNLCRECFPTHDPTLLEKVRGMLP